MYAAADLLHKPRNDVSKHIKKLELEFCWNEKLLNETPDSKLREWDLPEMLITYLRKVLAGEDDMINSNQSTQDQISNEKVKILERKVESLERFKEM